MAFVLNKKIVKDTEEYSNYAYGITLPVTRGNTGYFEQAFSSFEQETIVKSVGYWLPYINVKDIEVTMTDEMKDMHRAEIYVTFTVGNQIELQELTFIVKE